jgi:hypothetical protein
MTRGIFSSIINNDAYRESEKAWIVELQQYYTYWFGLLDDRLEGVHSRQLLIKYLTDLRKKVEEGLEKRFIYFISSSKKIRFDTAKKPRFGLFGNVLKIPIVIGKERAARTVKLKFDLSKDEARPSVETTEEFITFNHEDGSKLTMSVHDFLTHIGYDLGFPKKVEYVGYTCEPESRPTKGKHEGLTHILHRVSNEDCDIFITFNLFKVTSYATGSPSMLNFAVPNSMTDEIKVDLEGRIIEKCFIMYFDSDNQFLNKARERTELVNNLKSLSDQNKIRAIHICYEPEESSSFSALWSSKIPPKLRHVFSIKLNGDDLFVTPGSEYFHG